MKKSKRETSSEANRKQMDPSVRELKRFLWILPLAFGLLALVSWGYNLWCYVEVASPCEVAAQSGSDDEVRGCVAKLAHPHFYAGYEPYHGFGPEEAHREAARASAIVAAGSGYSDREMAFLVHEIAYYIPAFLEHKMSPSVPLSDGDRRVVASLAERYANGVHSGFLFSLFATLAAGILGLLYLLYHRGKLWEMVRPVEELKTPRD